MKSKLKQFFPFGFYGLNLIALFFFSFINIKALSAQVTPKPSPPNLSPGMSHGSMGMMDDQRFIIMMIPHHEGAIAMADLALTRAQQPEIKQLAKNIKTSQSQEIQQMQAWYKQWYGRTAPSFNTSNNVSGRGRMMGGGGMMGCGMMNMNTDLTALRNAKNFDQVFIEEMIPHHQMAVMMAQHLLWNAKHPEMKTLAQAIIKAQNQEIEKMQTWYQKWYSNSTK